VDIEHNFEPVFANLPEKASTIAKLKAAVRCLLLAFFSARPLDNDR
jgi:hypothetical protein